MKLLSDEAKNKLSQSWIAYPYVENFCISCGSCVALAPNVFDFNEKWDIIIKELSDYKNLWVEESISVCPVSAISWK